MGVAFLATFAALAAAKASCSAQHCEDGYCEDRGCVLQQGGLVAASDGANFAKTSKNGKSSKFLQNFGGFVLGCIKTKFCNKICV